jgi:hypothetical protein
MNNIEDARFDVYLWFVHSGFNHSHSYSMAKLWAESFK